MPKVVYTETKGLVQESGAGFDVTAGDSSSAHNLTLSMSSTTGTETLDADASTDVTVAVPAGAIVIGGKVEVTTVDSNAVDITTVGTGGDADKFAAGLTLDVDALGSAALVPTDLTPVASAITAVAVGLDGAAAGDGVVRVTLFYQSVA